MSTFFEIAYAAASNRLCLFTGTGFSKAVTENKAPSWQELLEAVCDQLPDPLTIKSALFPASSNNPLNLEEAAQVIDIELSKSGKEIHKEIAKIVSKLKASGDNTVISDFLKSNNSLRIVTTNYDKLAEELAGSDSCHSIAPGFPVPRSQARVKVYHVHGSIDSPLNMVVTSDDYFHFINGESYFSRKLSTILHENTVVIIGYSLADTNLKAIISDYKGFSRNQVIGTNLFLISRSKVGQYVKDYYAHCYGIRVLDQIEVHDFFKKLSASMDEAKKCASSSVNNLKKVLFDEYTYHDDYLKVESSFFEIISSVAGLGRSINDPLVVNVLGEIVQKKIDLTQKNGEWEQYKHLARWLIHLGSILELQGTSIEKTYLSGVLHSMNTMSKDLYIGRSWHSYTVWSNGWKEILHRNKKIICDHIEQYSTNRDALTLVGY